MPRPKATLLTLKLIAANLVALRMRENITQEDLAIVAGVKVTTISRWETASNRADQQSLRRIADAFGQASSDDFYEDELPSPIKPRLFSKEEKLPAGWRTEEIEGVKIALQGKTTIGQLREVLLRGTRAEEPKKKPSKARA